MKTNTRLLSGLLLVLLTSLISVHGFSTSLVQMVPGSENRLEVTESSYSRLQVVNSFSNFSYEQVMTEKGSFIRLFAAAYSKSSRAGDPELPVVSRLIEVPADAVPEVKVVSYTVKDYPLSDLGISDKIFPLQPPQPKNGIPLGFVYNAATYGQNAFLGDELARVNIQGYLRGVRMANLLISPVQYNPVTNTLRVYDNLVVDIRFKGADVGKTVSLRKKFDSPYFRSIYSRLLNLQPVEPDHDSMMKMPVKYVIVSDPMFQEALQPFIHWKIKKGFTVLEAYTNNPSVGTTTTSIKAYLQNLYTSSTPANPAPSFVLFVGDVQQIPAFICTSNGGQSSDLYYCEYTGDYLPEVYYGRFSASTVAQLQPQIDKTLEYEQYLMPDPSYLDECVMAAGADPNYGPVWGDGQINYGTNNYFNTAHNLNSHTYLQPEPAGGNYSQNIHTNVSNGICYANYTAHGSVSGWADPSFSVSDIQNLQNAHKYGLMVGNCCLTNSYEQDCFGEELLRAVNKGAVGYIGASNNSYWDEDFYWGVGVGPIVVNPTYETHGPGAYSRTFHDHGEPYQEWYSSMDQMVFAGNLAVQESNSGIKQYYWEIYCLMGDPSLMIYYSVPPALSVNYNPLLPIGSPVFALQTEPHAYVAVSENNVLHGAAEADANGFATLLLTPFTQTGFASVVVTAQNRKPFIDSVMVASAAGPYLVLNSCTIQDAGGNNNQVPETGEPLTTDLSLSNYGNADAVNAVSTLTTSDPYISLTNSSHTWPLIAGNSSASATDAFAFQAHDNMPDQHTAGFLVTTLTDTSSFTANLNVLFSAPELNAGIFSVNEATGGNGNGRLDPGETIYVTIPTTNNGHCPSADVIAQLFVFGDYITLNTAAQNLGSIAPGNTAEASFSFTISPNAPPGYSFSLYFTATAGMYNTCSSLFPTIGPQVEDYETGNFSRFSWHMAGNQPWKISSSIKYEGSFAATSGTISNSSRSEMYLDVIVLTADTISFYRKVSSEDGYDFLRFSVDDVEKGSWSGNLDWTKVKYPVSAGLHRFSWVYETDVSTLSGLNAGWIDYIVLPPLSEIPSGPLTVNMVAVSPTVCRGNTTQLYAFTTGGTGIYSYNWTPQASLDNSTIFNPVADPVETTTYHVVVNSGLFSTSNELTVTLAELPETPVATNLGSQISSSASQGNQWYGSQGPVPGATGQIFTPVCSDSYYTLVTNEAGCRSGASNLVYFGYTGIDPAISSQVSRLFPNPFTGKFILSYTLFHASAVKIQLFDAIGNLISETDEGNKAAGSYQTSVDGSKLAAGIYFCKFLTLNRVEAIKIIRSR